jgi:hypothetical protein
MGSSEPAAPRQLPASGGFSAHAAGEKLTLEELDQLTNNFADRYYTVLGSAVDSIKKGNPDPDQRRVAHRLKLNGVLAMNDIASSQDPYSQALDMVVAVTLQSIVWIDENRAERVFGDRAPILIQALQQMRVESWALAGRALTQDQLELLDYLITEWRRAHQNVDQVEFVKFDNFAGIRAASLLSELRQGRGLMAPLVEMSGEAREYRRLAERAFWYSKRAPSVAGIQAEAAVNEILATPEVDSLAHSASRAGATADRMVLMLEGLPAMFDARQRQLGRVMMSAQQLTLAVDELSTSVGSTLGTLDRTMRTADVVVGHYYVPDTSAKPFDVNEYTLALGRLNDVVTGVNQLATNADQIVRSPGWQRGLLDVSSLADRRVDRVFLHVYAALALAFVLAVAYRAIHVRLGRGAAGRGASA